VGFYCSVGDRGSGFLPNEKYYEILSHSKMGISFSMSAGKPQFKGRVIETMLDGGFLLNQRNKQAAEYLSEGGDYAAFSSKEELLGKIEYYLSHEGE
jgi:spore maturation protein CgeB